MIDCTESRDKIRAHAERESCGFSILINFVLSFGITLFLQEFTEGIFFNHFSASFPMVQTLGA